MAEATIEEIAGFISGNVKRKQIVDVLAKNGSESLESLRKITRMPKLLLEKGLKDMTEKGAVTKKGELYTLTEIGKAAATTLPKGSTKSGGHRFESNVQRDI